MLDKNVMLKVENLSKVYSSGRNNVYALKNINCEFKRSELVVIMGSSGSGKTTLLNIIGGLDSPTEGKILVNGTEMSEYHKEPFATEYRRKNVGFVFQFFQLLKDLTVEENVALPLILGGIEESRIKERTKEMLELVGLTNWHKHRPIELSGGQQQRVAIARALVNSPSLLLADEPTGNLDSKTSTEILNLIIETKKKLNQTVVLVTHDAKVASYSDRVLFFHDGTIVDEYNNLTDLTLTKKMDMIFNKFKKCIV